MALFHAEEEDNCVDFLKEEDHRENFDFDEACLMMTLITPSVFVGTPALTQAVARVELSKGLTFCVAPPEQPF